MDQELDPMFSRSAVRREKTSIVSPISFRVTESQQRRIKAFAAYRDMNTTEYLLSLVKRDERELRGVFDAMGPLFTNDPDETSDVL